MEELEAGLDCRMNSMERKYLTYKNNVATKIEVSQFSAAVNQRINLVEDFQGTVQKLIQEIPSIDDQM